jgi:hypothetical protein
MKAGQILVADRGYDRGGFVEGLRGLGVRAHPSDQFPNSDPLRVLASVPPDYRS